MKGTVICDTNVLVTYNIVNIGYCKKIRVVTPILLNYLTVFYIVTLTDNCDFEKDVFTFTTTL